MAERLGGPDPQAAITAISGVQSGPARARNTIAVREVASGGPRRSAWASVFPGAAGRNSEVQAPGTHDAHNKPARPAGGGRDGGGGDSITVIPPNGEGDDRIVLGSVSVSAWRERVRGEVLINREIGQDEILKSKIFMIPEDDISRAEGVTDLFNTRVAELLAAHRRANDPASETDEPLKGAKVLVLTFSKGTQLGGADPDRLKKDAIMPYINNALLASEENGDLVTRVDMQNPQDFSHRPNLGFVPTHNLRGAFNYLAKDQGQEDMKLRKPSKPIILIIDGYGEHAAKDLGFRMEDTFFGDLNVSTILIRASQEQSHIDLNSYGSVWQTKARIIDKAGEFEKLLALELHDNLYTDFDQTRFESFVEALETVTKRVQAGEQVVLQAPNNFGKTTALQQLAELEPEGIAVLYIDQFGTLKNLSDDNEPTQEELAQKPTIIIDEAGRVKAHDATAPHVIAQLEEQGKAIVRVYPGNVEVPYETVTPRDFAKEVEAEMALSLLTDFFDMEKAKAKMDELRSVDVPYLIAEDFYRYYERFYSDEGIKSIVTSMRAYIVFLTRTAEKLHGVSSYNPSISQNKNESKITFTVPGGKLTLVARGDNYYGGNSRAQSISVRFTDDNGGKISFSLSDDREKNANERYGRFGARDTRRNADKSKSDYIGLNVHAGHIYGKLENHAGPAVYEDFTRSMGWAAAVLAGLHETQDWSTFTVPKPEELYPWS